MNTVAEDLKQIDVVNVEQLYAEIKFKKYDLELYKADEESLIGELKIINNILSQSKCRIVLQNAVSSFNNVSYLIRIVGFQIFFRVIGSSTSTGTIPDAFQ